jgi:hypothetical protein
MHARSTSDELHFHKSTWSHSAVAHMLQYNDLLMLTETPYIAPTLHARSQAYKLAVLAGGTKVKNGRLMFKMLSHGGWHYNFEGKSASLVSTEAFGVLSNGTAVLVSAFGPAKREVSFLQLTYNRLAGIFGTGTSPNRYLSISYQQSNATTQPYRYGQS